MLECGLLAKGTLVYSRKGPMRLGKLGERNAGLVPGMGLSHCPSAGWGLAGWEWLCREGAVLQGETAWFMQFKANQD